MLSSVCLPFHPSHLEPLNSPDTQPRALLAPLLTMHSNRNHLLNYKILIKNIFSILNSLTLQTSFIYLKLIDIACTVTITDLFLFCNFHKSVHKLVNFHLLFQLPLSTDKTCYI